MVQRKVPNRLGVKASNGLDKAKKSLASMRPSIPQNCDAKTSKGADLLKRKMMLKKSCSFKRSDSDSLSSSSIRRNEPLSHAGKPSSQTPSKLSPPQRSPPSSSPNYMKSTASSQAKREQTTQMIVETPASKRTFPGTLKRLSFSPPSGRKTSRSLLSKASSLEKVRTLTKAPSFKPSRASSSAASKCSKVVFCSSPDAQRATCCSTLKNSKFPPYLDLHPGGTESQGTSIMKVCPYTYCSLNGHHHSPSPPLKCFLASRRSMLKTQKGMKPKVLMSTRKAKASSASTVKEVYSEMVSILDDKPVFVNEDGADFFIEIYAKQIEEEALKADGLKRDGSDQETVKNNIEAGPEGSLSDEKPNSMIDYEGSIFKEKNSVSSLGLDSTRNFQESAPNEELGWDSSTCITLEELFADSSTCITLEELFADSSDVEWEEGRPFLTGLNENDSFLSQSDRDYDQAFGDPTRYEILFLEEEQGFEMDDIGTKFLEEFCKDESLERSHHEEIMEKYSDFDLSSYDANMEIDRPTQDCAGQGDTVLLDDGETNDLSHSENQTAVTGSAERNCASEEETKLFGDIETDSLPTVDKSDLLLAFVTNDGENTGEDYPEEQPVSVADLKDEAANPESLDARKDPPLVNKMEEREQDDGDSESLIDTESSLLTGNYNGIFEADRSSKKRRSEDLEEQSNSSVKKLCLVDSTNELWEQMETENAMDSVAEEGFPEPESKTNPALNKTLFDQKGHINREIPNICDASRIKIIKGGKPAEEESNELKEFNPREANFLPLEADLDAEKVDLRHQKMDERKNAEEWMTDFALRRAVDQLAPARKKNVALLVEAFEKVMPTHRYESHMRSIPTGFLHPRRLQACN